MSGRAWKSLLPAPFFLAASALLFLAGLSYSFNRPLASAAPSSYSWPNLRTDTVSITFSVRENIWSSGTGDLIVKTHNSGTFSDTKSTTATVTVPEGVYASVYVCGDDRYTRMSKPCDKWYPSEKWLRVYVDGAVVYELGKEYWWAHCYSRAATLGPGTHEVKLVIYASVASYCDSGGGEWYVGQGFLDIQVEGGGSAQASSHSAEATLDSTVAHSFTFTLPQITGDGVGFTSGEYLVTEIKRKTKVVGGTLIGSAIWANSGSTIEFNQAISYYASNEWVTEKVRGGVETGYGETKVFEELNVSRKVSFSSKNRSDGLELTVRIPRLTLVFTHIVVSAERNGESVNAKACWAHDNSPIAGLRLRCFETDQSMITDFNGRVSFRIAGSGFEVTIYPTEGRNGITAYEKARVRI